MPTRLAIFIPAATLVTVLFSSIERATFAVDTEAQVVTLEIDFGDRGETKRLEDIAWRANMTVLEVMDAAKKNERITFKYLGSKAKAFLTTIDDVKNEGAEGRNWVYHVNETKATQSFGVQKVKPNDVIRWRFASPTD